MVGLIKALIRAYHATVSPLLGARCRYVPTCSDYASQALDQYGAAKGTWLTVKRVCRCHPWGGDGYDPVPPCDKKPEQNIN